MHDKPCLVRAHVLMYMNGWNIAMQGIDPDRAAKCFERNASSVSVNRLLDRWEFLSGYQGALQYNRQFAKGHGA